MQELPMDITNHMGGVQSRTTDYAIVLEPVVITIEGKAVALTLDDAKALRGGLGEAIEHVSACESSANFVQNNGHCFALGPTKYGMSFTVLSKLGTHQERSSADVSDHLEMLRSAADELAKMQAPKVIGIAGVTGSGKSLLVSALHDSAAGVQIVDGQALRKSPHESFLTPEVSTYVFDEIPVFDQVELAYLLTVLIEERCTVVLLYQCESDLRECVRKLIRKRFSLTRDGLFPFTQNNKIR